MLLSQTEVLWFFFVLLPLTILVLMKFISNGDLFQMLAFFFFSNFLFPFSIKNTTNNETQELFIYKKNKT